MKKQKGFTIIELIVVIAIIAVLAAVVLLNVTGYINKGKDAASKAEMHTFQTDVISAATASPSSNYSGACPATATDPAFIAIQANDSSAVCAIKADNTAWCACFKELAPSTTTYYCADSTGAVKEQTVKACATECVAATALCL